ncbi:hypothetical protein SAMN05444401_4078 [Clostridium amylolyticum]|uniref:Uncharacterized protein n=1 Tax=Clostridium amylolyticum TaxID=1121298 RepID=A0A1M6MQK6_9CLOT|nr:hypothetical protein [Clostridium amylolyticum]SHJ85788.1 hypothetical protein SAMN05444401_4078 [Clostridium amylolyticum]
MAKRKGRREDDRSPQGFDTNQLMSMLGNVDLNQLSSLLGSLNTNGFNINNMNLDGIKNQNNQVVEGRTSDKDNTVQLLNSLKSFVPPNKVKMVDKIIDMYLSGEFDE